MYETIPIMEKQDVKTAYAQHLQQLLGESSLWTVGIAGFTSGVIVNPRPGEKIQQNGAGMVGRMYVLGVPQKDEKPEIRGIGLVIAGDIVDTPFYRNLTGERGYVNDNRGGMLKSLDTTAQVVQELKDLEALVFLKEDFVI